MTPHAVTNSVLHTRKPLAKAAMIHECPWALSVLSLYAGWHAPVACQDADMHSQQAGGFVKSPLSKSSGMKPHFALCASPSAQSSLLNALCKAREAGLSLAVPTYAAVTTSVELPGFVSLGNTFFSLTITTFKLKQLAQSMPEMPMETTWWN